jgi:isopenicillin-N epimerase
VTSLETAAADLDDWPEARALWRLDPDVAHLNHGSFGAVPGPVAEVQRELRDRMHANPVRFFKVERRPLIESAREAGAAFVGADPGGFALVTNATTAASSVLAGFPLAAGDEVLVTDHGYGAVTYAVERACAGSSARLVTVDVPLDADPATIEGLITAAVTPRTRLAVIDHITSPTARLFPVERIVPALQERGVAVFVDAAHAPGMLPLDLAALEPDFWTGNFHKWPSAPAGAGGLYVAPRWRARTRPLVASWNEPEGYPSSFDDYGTADPTSWLAMPAAFEVLGGLGWDRLRRRNTALVAAGQALVAAALGLDPAAQLADEELWMRFVELPVEAGVITQEDSYRLYERIAGELGVVVAVIAWRGRGLLRISAHAYNSLADYRRLAAGLPLDW